MKSIFKSTERFFSLLVSAFHGIFTHSHSNPLYWSRAERKKKNQNRKRNLYDLFMVYRRLSEAHRVQYNMQASGRWGRRVEILMNWVSNRTPSVRPFQLISIYVFILFDGQTNRACVASTTQRCQQMFTIWLDEFHLIALLRLQLCSRSQQYVNQQKKITYEW